MTNFQPIHLIHFSWDLRHLLLDTAPTLLRCNDSFVHPSHRMHPTQKFVRRHQHDQTSAQIRTPADLGVSPLARNCRATYGSEDGAALELEASCPNRTVFLNLSGCCCLWSSFTNLDVSHSVLFVLVFPDVTARCVRVSNRHLLISSTPGFHRHIPCTSLYTSSFFSLWLALSQRFCLFRIHPCFSRQGSLDDRSDSLSAFIVVWLCRISMRCQHRTSWTLPCVRELQCPQTNVESSGFSFWCSFNHNPWKWGSRSFFVSRDFRLPQFWSHHLPRSTTQTFPVRRFPSIAQCLSCPTLASHNSILGSAQKTAPVRS